MSRKFDFALDDAIVPVPAPAPLSGDLYSGLHRSAVEATQQQERLTATLDIMRMDIVRLMGIPQSFLEVPLSRTVHDDQVDCMTGALAMLDGYGNTVRVVGFDPVSPDHSP